MAVINQLQTPESWINRTKLVQIGYMDFGNGIQTLQFGKQNQRVLALNGFQQS